MRLIDELYREHELIEAVAGSFRAFVAARRRGEGNPADGARYLSFFRRYAGDFHHAREEDTLFVALMEHARLPESGPIAALRADHQRLAGLLDDIELRIADALLDDDAALALQRAAHAYAAALCHHIDAENSVLLPESEPRLRREGIFELPSREMTLDEQAALTAGLDLVRRYPPIEDRTITRGDGCVCCPALLQGCRGLEFEWWNQWEWEEFEDHLGAD